MKPWVIRSTEGLLGAALPHNKSHSEKMNRQQAKSGIISWSMRNLFVCFLHHPPPFARPKKTVNRGCNVEERRRTDESRRFKTWRRTRRKGVVLIWSNMNCRKVLATISITWHPFFSLPLSYSASISLLPWKRVSAHTIPFPPLGFCDLPPCLSISISMPSIGIGVEQYWQSIKSLPLPLSLSALHPILWLSLTFHFWISISVSAGSNGIRWLNKAPKNTSVSHTHGFLPVFSFPDVLLYLCFLSLSLSSFRNTRAKNLSGLFWTLSLSLSVAFSFSLFNLNVHPSQWIRFAVKQQVGSVYTPSGPTNPPRQTEGNLHLLPPDSSTTRFSF